MLGFIGYMLRSFIANNLFKIIGFLAVTAVLGSAVLYYNWSQSTIKTLRQNEAILKQAVVTQQQTIDSLVEDFDSATAILKDLMSKNTKYNDQLNELYTKFTKNGRSLAKLAKAKPALIEKIINDATKESIACTEALTRGEQCKK